MITNKMRLEEDTEWGNPNMTRYILENNNKVFIDELNKFCFFSKDVSMYLWISELILSNFIFYNF